MLACSLLATYRRNQEQLMQAPAAHTAPAAIDLARVHEIIAEVLDEGRQMLTEPEAKALLAASGIPVAAAEIVAADPLEAADAARAIDFPVVLKILSPDISHKSDVGGVALRLESEDDVRRAASAMLARVQRLRPDAQVQGFTVQSHVHRPRAIELIVGSHVDPLFGPVILFGEGGTAVEVVADRAVALPPLNQFLARDLIDSNQVARLLGPVKKMPPVNLDALNEVLICISEMVCELPWLKELDLNPLIVDENGAIAADARIVIDHTLGNSDDRYAHMAIHPFPAHLTQVVQLPDGRSATFRPVRPEDADLERDFVKDMSEESRYFRFMEPIRELPSTMVVRFTQIDYDREMALVATIDGEDGVEKQIGNARYVLTPDGQSVEFRLAIGDDWQKCGLGRRLMSALIDYARRRGYRAMVGDVLANNSRLFRMVQRLGFTIHPHPELPAAKRVVKPLYK